MTKKYTFIYEGQTYQNCQPVEVKEKLSEIFQIPVQTLDGIFEGNQYFERDDLPLAVAKQYLQLFKSAGAIGDIKERSEDIIETTAVTSEIQREKDNFDDQSRDEAKLLKRSGLLIFVVFIIDNTLTITSPFGNSFIDAGYYPYIIAHLLLIYACARAAISKGYSFLWGGLGAFSFLGVAILLLLSKKGDKWSIPSLKTTGVAIICLAISSAWVYDFSNRQIQLLQVTHQNEQLPHHVNQFPTKFSLINSELISDKKRTLDDFQNNIFYLISEFDYRSNEKKRLAELAFNSTANFRIWLNYLRYLSYTQKETILPELEKKTLSKLDNNIAKQFDTAFPRIDSYFLWNLKEEWQFGLESKNMQKIWGMDFNLIQWNIRKDIERFSLSDSNFFEETIDVSSLDLAGTKGIKITSTRNRVKIEIMEGPMRGESLVLGVYKIPSKFKTKGRKSYKVIIELIFSSFPAKYLPMNINPLKSYLPGY